jgi:hypothetical protein
MDHIPNYNFTSLFIDEAVNPLILAIDILKRGSSFMSVIETVT